jgi:hypothetical protein
MTSKNFPAPEAPLRVTVTRMPQGWEVSEERGNSVVRRAMFTDWHRVERAIGLHGPRHGADVPATVTRRTDVDPE